jgi:hypothetical protein
MSVTRSAGKLNLDILKATPGRMARMVGVPVTMASHAGRFEGLAWPGEAIPYPSANQSGHEYYLPTPLHDLKERFQSRWLIVWYPGIYNRGPCPRRAPQKARTITSASSNV